MAKRAAIAGDNGRFHWSDRRGLWQETIPMATADKVPLTLPGSPPRGERETSHDPPARPLLIRLSLRLRSFFQAIR